MSDNAFISIRIDAQKKAKLVSFCARKEKSVNAIIHEFIDQCLGITILEADIGKAEILSTKKEQTQQISRLQKELKSVTESTTKKFKELDKQILQLQTLAKLNIDSVTQEEEEPVTQDINSVTQDIVPVVTQEEEDSVTQDIVPVVTQTLTSKDYQGKPAWYGHKWVGDKKVPCYLSRDYEKAKKKQQELDSKYKKESAKK